MKKETKQLLFIGLIVILLALSRLLKHPFNFTPVAAMALFAGCYLKKQWGIVLPILGMLVSDYFIGFYDWKLMAAVYVGIGAAFYLGWFLQNKVKWYRVVLAALASSLFFFITSNFAVWFFYEWYPHTWAGLVNCFTLALPFFRNTFLGDLVYSGVIFGAYELALRYASKRELEKTSLVEQA